MDNDATTRFSEQLRLEVKEQWNRLVNHKFTVELANGTVDSNGEAKDIIHGYPGRVRRRKKLMAPFLL